MILNIFVFKDLLCVFEIYPTCYNILLYPFDFLGQLFENPLFSLSLPTWLALSLLSLSFFISTLYAFRSLSVLVLLRLSSVFNNLDPSQVQFFFPFILPLSLLIIIKQSKRITFGIIVTILIKLVKRTFIINI